MYKYLMLFLVAAGLAAVGAGAYFYYGGDSQGVTIVVNLPDKVEIGVPFEASVGISNAGRTVLNDTKVSLSLPEGVAFVGSSVNKNSESKNFGRIGVGSVIEQTFNLVALDGAQSLKQLIAKASYLPEGVSSRFETQKEFDLAVGDAGILLDLKAPERAQASEDFSLEVSYKNISGVDFDNLQLKLDYPPSFEFKKSTLAPDLGKNIWRLGGLRKGSEMKFTVTGNLIGPEASKHDITAMLRAELSGELYNIATSTATLELTSSPLTLTVRANGNPDYIAGAGDDINYLITYTNNADQGFRDAVLRIDLKGEMFDSSTIKASGIVAPGGGSIVWNTATNPELAVIPPHSSGAMSFGIKTRSVYPIRRLSDKNFVLKAEARIESPTIMPSVQSASTVGVGRLETKVRGGAKLETKIFFRDADSGILNKGPVPPKVGAATNYTVHWILRTYSSDITDVIVSANLAPGVRYAGVMKSSSPGSWASNDAGLIGWSFDKIPATKGVIDKPYEVVFQIEATPGANNAKNYMPLIGETVLTAKDDFTGADLRVQDDAVDTRLPDDPTIGSGGGIVAP